MRLTGTQEIVGAFLASVMAFGLAIGVGLVAFAANRPCVTEDSNPGLCYWNAQTRGNHKGRSYVVANGGRVIYLP